MRGLLLVGLALIASCGDPTAPQLELPVPSGETNPEWASIGKTCTKSSPATSLPENLRPAPPPPEHRTSDDMRADLGRTVPGGFGGLMIRDGVLTFYLVDTTRHAEAVVALKSSSLGAGRDWTGNKVLPGRWNFAQMYDWYRYVNDEVWAIPGVQFSSVDEGKNRVVFGVSSPAARTQIETVLAGLDAPCFLFAVSAGFRAPGAE